MKGAIYPKGNSLFIEDSFKRDGTLIISVNFQRFSNPAQGELRTVFCYQPAIFFLTGFVSSVSIYKLENSNYHSPTIPKSHF